MKVFSTRKIMQFGKDLLRKEGVELEEWTENRDLTPEELVKHCKHADALLSIGPNKLDAEFFEKCSHLKVISLHSVGYDHVDLEAAKRFGVKIGNTPGVLTQSTADTAFLLMQSVARLAFHQHKKILKGKWGFSQPGDDLGIDLEGKTLGIFGLGSIGFAMAKRSQDAFGMKIIYHNRSSNEEAEKELGAEKVSLDELLEQSDIISLHANLSEETEGVFNAGAFSKMKRSAIFINTARGKMHNETDLTDALKTRKIWGAGLDVTNPEPMRADNELLNMPTVCVLPHMASATVKTREGMLRMAVENVIAGLKGEELPTEVK